MIVRAGTTRPAADAGTTATVHRRWPMTGPTSVLLAALFVVAFGVRLALTLRTPGGLGGNLSDDAATYYAGADALVHGRLPYGDFVLLHPPLLDLLLTPFAAFGAVVGDHLGFMTATVFAELLGATNAVLVVLVARRYGVGRDAAFLGGVFYAGWLGSASGEHVIALETVGVLAFLLGLLALAGPVGTRSALLGGTALGAAATAKLTWVVVPVVVVGWWLADRRTRATTPALVGGVVLTPTLVCGVFLLAAPRAMVRMVVADQFARPPQGGPTEHLRALTFLDVAAPGLSRAASAVLLAALAALTVLVVGLAWRHRPTRLLVVLAVVSVVVLALSPSYFSHYAVFAAPGLALAVAAAAASWRPPVRWSGGVVAVTAVVVALAMTTDVLTDARSRTPVFPRAAVAAAIGNTRCPTPDAPIVLIQTDTLSRTLADGCPNWIDVTGRVYDVDRPERAGVRRTRNERWQRSLRRYLYSGDVVVLTRPALGIGRRLQRDLDRLPLLLERDGVVVRRVR